ncbi:MAG: protein serine/threonine phosphatase [Ilumatobacteraceae bacterium]|nr:protein serine/threonine phosphatase [Ilumatobacteraceae bacterium]
MTALRRVHRLPWAILAAGLAVFVVLAVACHALFDQSEQRLLQQRTNEAGLILSASINDASAPLDAAAALAVIDDGDPTAFAKAVGPFVGDTKTFTSAVLYRIGDATPIATVGAPPALTADQASAMLAKSVTTPFVLVDLLQGDRRRLGYGISDSATPATYVVYGERTLSVNPNVRRRTEQPFSGLDYAIYLGTEPAGKQLLGSSLQESSLPISGTHASTSVPFGDNSMDLVMTPTGHLGGWLFASLWWLVLAVGAAVSIAFATLVERLLSRRDTALSLAAENERLYDDQRQIAESLQLSLLPQHLVPPTGAHVAARYWPAGSANLIGGDFYDAFRVDADRSAITIGDVCGKGIEAAGLTGLARHTIRAAARTSRDASEVLRAVHVGLEDQRPATFCTACFAYVAAIDDYTWSVQLALGGHPQPVLRRANGEVELVGFAGTLLGMVTPKLTDVTFSVGGGDTLVFYTDGLTDAPGDQSVDIEQVELLLRATGDAPIEQIADDIRVLKRAHRPSGSADDTALIIVRFGVPAPPDDRAGPPGGADERAAVARAHR